jgi:hypothetical protein
VKMLLNSGQWVTHSFDIVGAYKLT